MDNQNYIEYIKDQLDQGKISVSEANVSMVRAERFRIVDGPLHKSVRSSLMSAVKSGELNRLTRKGLRPEVFYHPNFKIKAIEARNRIYRESLRRLSHVYGSGTNNF